MNRVTKQDFFQARRIFEKNKRIPVNAQNIVLSNQTSKKQTRKTVESKNPRMFCFKCKKPGHLANKCVSARGGITNKMKSVGIISK